MGVNDTGEQLDAAITECIRLERELAIETSRITRAASVLADGIDNRWANEAAVKAHRILTDPTSQDSTTGATS